MTEVVTLTLWLLLALVQQHGAVAMTFGQQATCTEVRDALRAKADTVALSNCVPIEVAHTSNGPMPHYPKSDAEPPTWPPVPP